MTVPFRTIQARAEKRKGGAKVLNRLLPRIPDPKALAKLGDDRVLAEMTRRVFSRRLRLERHRGEMAGLRGGVSRVRSRPAVRYSPTISGTA